MILCAEITQPRWAVSRLNELRDLVGLHAGSHDQQQRDSLPKVATLLATGRDDPGVVLSVAQLLFADGESTLDVVVKKAVAPFRQILDGEWGNLAANPQERTLVLKVLLVDQWDPETMIGGGYDALSLAASPWWSIPTRDRQLRPEITQFVRSLYEAGARDNFDEWEAGDLLGKELSKFSQKVPEADALKGELSATPVLPASTEKLVGVLGNHASAISTTRAATEAVRARLGRWAPDVDAQLVRCSSRSEILWWGQARFCGHKLVPLRSLDVPARRWWSAYELSERVDQSQSEPAASYLAETLAGMGVAPDERRSLADWCADLHETLRKETPPALPPKFAAKIGECALGLAVSWIRNTASDPFNEDLLAEATALDTKLMIPSWEWSAWLLRECMLARLVG